MAISTHLSAPLLANNFVHVSSNIYDGRESFVKSIPNTLDPRDGITYNNCSIVVEFLRQNYHEVRVWGIHPVSANPKDISKAFLGELTQLIPREPTNILDEETTASEYIESNPVGWSTHYHS